MIGYMLQQSPLWAKLPNGKRNVRIMLVALTVYTFIHAIADAYRETNGIAKFIHGYFLWIIAIDFFACACLYRTHYGRSIVNEFKRYETDEWDEKNHRYYKTEPETNTYASYPDLREMHSIQIYEPQNNAMTEEQQGADYITVESKSGSKEEVKDTGNMVEDNDISKSSRSDTESKQESCLRVAI